MGGPLLLRTQDGEILLALWRKGTWRDQFGSRIAPDSVDGLAFRLYAPLAGDLSRFGGMARSVLQGLRAELWPILGAGLGAALLGLLVPLATAWRPRASGEDAPHASIRRLLWIWIVAIFVFFTISRTKQDLYLLPVIPAVAALVADALESTSFGAAHRGLRALLIAVAVLTAVAGIALPWLLSSGFYAVAGIWPVFFATRDSAP